MLGAYPQRRAGRAPADADERVGQQLILLKAAVDDVKAAGPQGLAQLLGLTGLAAGQRGVVGHTTQDVEAGTLKTSSIFRRPARMGLKKAGRWATTSWS